MIWIPLTLLLLNRSVLGVTRLVALLLQAQPAQYANKSRNAESSNRILASNSRYTAACTLRNRRPQEVDGLPPDAPIVAVPPGLQYVFHHACSAYEQLHRCQGVLNQAQYHMWQERGPSVPARKSAGVSLSTPNCALKSCRCGAAPAPTKLRESQLRRRGVT
jgi:hypothetical protein